MRAMSCHRANDKGWKLIERGSASTVLFTTKYLSDVRPISSAYVGGVFHTMTHDARRAGPSTLSDLVAEQTPGGMNEMVISEQRADGAYASLEHSLDSIYSRLCGAHDPSLAPAKRRK